MTCSLNTASIAACLYRTIARRGKVHEYSVKQITRRHRASRISYFSSAHFSSAQQFESMMMVAVFGKPAAMIATGRHSYWRLPDT